MFFLNIGAREEVDWSKALPNSVSVKTPTLMLESDLFCNFLGVKIPI